MAFMGNRVALFASLVMALTAAACGDVKTEFTDAAPDIDAAGADAEVDAPPGDATLTIDRTSSDLGSVIVGQTSAPSTFLISNSGTVATGAVTAQVSGTGYTISSNGCSGPLAPNASCSVSVTVTPSAPGTASGTLTVTASPGGSVNASLTATALAPGALSITPPSFDYGIVVAGSASATATYTVQNTGGAESGTITVALGGSHAGDFQIASNGCSGTLAGGASCQVTARFAPGASASGTRAATLTASASPGGAAVSNLSGTAQIPAVLALGGSGAFGDLPVGQTATRTITVTNNGQQTSGTLTVSRSGSAAFSILTGMAGDCVSGSTTLAGTASCNVRIQFAPAASGAVTGTLTVSASPGGTQNTALSGNGQNPPTLSPNITSAAFGQVEVSVLSSSSATWTITNTGDLVSSVPSLNLSTTELEVSGNTCTAGLSPGGQCSMTVRFRPSAAGARTGTATLSVTGSSVNLSTSATGMWRVTVTRTGTSGTITSVPAGISCPGTCTALFNPGSLTLQARSTNGSGVYFASWSGTSAGTCAGSPFRDCALTVDGTEAVTGTFNALNSNLVFVSSATYATNLGGVAPYDSACNALATAAGINNAAGNNFVAWISSANSTALSRLGGAGVNASGWIRMDGRVFASTRTSLLGQAILNPARFNEHGADAFNVPVMTGTNSDGTVSSTQTCSDWTSTSGSVQWGYSTGGPDAWTAGTGAGCSSTHGQQRILCMMRQYTAGVTPGTFTGKRVWLSNNPFTVAAGANPDTVCNTDRPAGVSQGRALIARTTSTAGSLLTAGQMYVRPDGQEVGTGTELINNIMRGGIWQLGNGTYSTANPYVWNGATSLTALGTVATTCNNWVDPNQAGGPTGLWSYPRGYWWNFTTRACNSTGFFQPRLYCYEP